MKRDEERINRIRQALKDAKIDAVVCALPMNVLLLTGYWSVVGASLAIFTSAGNIVLLVPEDERELAENGWADEVKTFATGSLNELKSIGEAVQKPLAEIAAKLKIKGKIGFESDAVSEPVTYAAMNLYGAGIERILTEAMPEVSLVPAGKILTKLRSVLTQNEIERVKIACRIAEQAFLEGVKQIKTDLSETEIAASFRKPLSVFGVGFENTKRAGGFTFCMSGENSYRAFAAYQISDSRKLKTGDLALIHCNSYADGFWTDITRTFCLNAPDEKKLKMYEAVFAALQPAIKTIRSGVKASEVDRAAREILTESGFGREFRHGLGHAVGFHAIDHNAPPRLHPASFDVLETGMVFNIEPAIYIENFGGIRHCEMIAVTEAGAEILTPFQRSLEELIIR